MRDTLREALTTLLEVAGAVTVATGVAMIYAPAGVIVAGAGLFGVSYLLETKGKRR